MLKSFNSLSPVYFSKKVVDPIINPLLIPKTGPIINRFDIKSMLQNYSSSNIFIIILFIMIFLLVVFAFNDNNIVKTKNNDDNNVKDNTVDLLKLGIKDDVLLYNKLLLRGINT